MEKSLIQVSKIQNLDSLIPRRRPPEAPLEALEVQCVMVGLRAFRVLVEKVSGFLVSWTPTMSMQLLDRKSLRARRLLAEPKPLAFQLKMLTIYSLLGF